MMNPACLASLVLEQSLESPPCCLCYSSFSLLSPLLPGGFLRRATVDLRVGATYCGRVQGRGRGQVHRGVGAANNATYPLAAFLGAAGENGHFGGGAPGADS